MNTLERRMVDALRNLKEHHAVVGVKAEFEAEGTRMDEMLRLKEVCMRANLDLTIKIGGCEALRDMYECKTIGVCRVVAPMVESPFALTKFVAAAKLAFPGDEQDEVTLGVNIETISACHAFDKMIELPQINQIGDVVFGRVDMCGSLGLSRDSINSDVILKHASELFEKAKRSGLTCCVGGGVSADSLPFFRDLPGLVDRYETRKVIFACPAALKSEPEQALLKAVGFELLWLRNKRDYYAAIANEDKQRLELLESRYRRQIEAVGGTYS
ncbi:MAG: aldolase [Pirellulaceae bacterium]|nr:aldolase [Pirellulaceae bacterium]